MNIRIVCQYTSPEEGIVFLNKVSPTLASIGVSISHKFVNTTNH